MDKYTNAARMMARGGAVMKFAPGGTTATSTAATGSQFPPFTAGTVNVAGSSNPVQQATGPSPVQTASQAITPQAAASTASPTSDIVSFSEQRVTQPGVPVGGVTLSEHSTCFYSTGYTATANTSKCNASYTGNASC
jgi:hypothetical protein